MDFAIWLRLMSYGPWLHSSCIAQLGHLVVNELIVFGVLLHFVALGIKSGFIKMNFNYCASVLHYCYSGTYVLC
jgi:hypothetical protein